MACDKQFFPGARLSELWGKGHWARQYRVAEGYGSAAANPQEMGGSISIVTDGRNGVEMHLALRQNGREVYGLLDTGCDQSVISRSVIPKEVLKSTTKNLCASNGTEIDLVGEVELTLKLAEQKVTATVVVSDEVNDLMLGIDCLNRHRCRWSFAQNVIEIYGRMKRLISRLHRSVLRRICAVESTVISAGHTTNVPAAMSLSLLRQTSDD